DVVGSECEFREQRPRRGRSEPGLCGEFGEQDPGEAAAALLELAEHGGAADAAAARGEWQLAAEGPEQRRLAATVRPDDGDAGAAVAEAQTEGDGAEPNPVALDDSAMERGDRARRRRLGEGELEPPRRPRLVDLFELLEVTPCLRHLRPQSVRRAAVRATGLS